ncbi:site-2 protease family protein [Mycolicibacterium holsaticum]|uniref:site-2 protease family protein n=1 Tax=Mycolicibacterium holsaticum TaxID=152142 RepID=UPI001E3E8C5B|nr:site-2 protease family protein [Mycolicibacterium holsaticum]MDA4108453.1 peptidase M50 [Mycolicibacterium holsaticum DSM 44478 = JCM 12374]UNC09732.1 site-2 protease family protein [Mycolicibacterium holsaticum DSM 44478 = JCM 12374]
MKATVRLGRIAGVSVGMHWSVLGIVLLLVIGLSVQFPVLAEGYATWEYILAAVVTAVLFVVSLLAHELAHAIWARRNGVGVDGITLWLLGGVARLRGDALTPGAAFRIAVVGPLTSVLAGAVFGVAAMLADDAGFSSLTVSVLSYLALINVVLAVFNLIPAAPLDGGRILRAAIWAWRGDQYVATVWAARAGRLFGFLLIGLGLIRIISGMGGLWWILLGLFIVTMASAEEHQARTTTMLAGVRVQDVMTADPETVSGDRTVGDFLRDVVLLRRHSAFPLVDGFGRVEGLITFNRLRSVPMLERDTVRLRDVACPPQDVPSATPDEPLTDLLPRLSGCADGRALVYDHERLVGIVSPSDVSRAVALHGMGVWAGGGGSDITTDLRQRRR